MVAHCNKEVEEHLAAEFHLCLERPGDGRSASDIVPITSESLRKHTALTRSA